MPYQAGGKYAGRIVSAEMTESQKGTIGFEIRVESVEGMFPRAKILWVSPGAVDQTLKVLREIGVSEEQLYDKEELCSLTRTLKGNDCSFTVCEKEYQGDVHLEIEWLNGPHKVMSRETKASLGSKAADMFRAAGSGQPVLASAPRTGANEPEPFSPIVDDDVPF